MLPRILIVPSQQQKGAEFSDASLSLSHRYLQAIHEAGGAPLVLPLIPDPALITEMVETCAGVLLTGGDDVNPDLYGANPPPPLRKTISPIDQERDYVELLVVNEVFRLQRPLLAICRGHQILNVALGGTLLIDIPTQVKNSIPHKVMNRKNDVVHEIELSPGSLIEKISRSPRLGVNSSHHQAVDKIAPALQVTGKSEDGIIEVMELHADNWDWVPYLMSVQYHPERLFDRHPVHRALFESFVGACRLGV